MGPPEPFVPAERVGKPTLGMFVLYVGNPDEGVDVVAPLRALGTPVADVVQPMRTRPASPSSTATAASQRDATYMLHPIAQWSDPADDATHTGWARALQEAMAPWTTGGVYLNFEQAEGADIVRRGYSRPKLARLRALKEAWDPGNLFRFNQNIASSVQVPSPRGVDLEAGRTVTT